MRMHKSKIDAIVDDSEKLESQRAGTFNSTIFNILKNVITSGFLSLPFAMRQASVIPGLLVMCAVAFFNGLTFVLLARCAQESKVYSYGELWSKAFGSKYAMLTDICVLLLTLGGGTVIVILIGDFGAVLGSICSPDTYCTNRQVQQIIVTLVVLLPLSLLKDLHALRHSSVLGVVFIGYTGLFLITNYPEESHDYVLWSPSRGAFQALAIFTTSFSAHYNSPRYFQELKSQSIKEFSKITICAYVTILVFYALVGVVPYVYWGEAANGNILKMFPDTFQVILVKVSMVLSITMSFPFLLSGLRSATERIFVERPDEETHRNLSVGLVLLTLTLGLWFDDIGNVNALRGAVLGSLIVYVFPPLFFLNINSAQRTFQEKLVCWVTIGFGFASGSLGLLLYFN